MTNEELLIKLYDQPSEIAQKEYMIGELKLDLKEGEQLLENRQNDIAMSREAKAWGSNEEERKLAKAAAYRADILCKQINERLFDLRAEIMAQEVAVNRERNLFYALRSMAELSAAMLLGGKTVGGAVASVATAEELGL